MGTKWQLGCAEQDYRCLYAHLCESVVPTCRMQWMRVKFEQRFKLLLAAFLSFAD
jgi:hypothetical protein